MTTRNNMITEYKNTCLRKPLIVLYNSELNSGNITVDEWFSKITNLYTPASQDKE